MVNIPESEWIIRENMHTPIVSKETWLMAQAKMIRNKSDNVRRNASGEEEIFTGILKCVHCGGRLNKVNRTTKTHPNGIIRCSTYSQKSKEACHVQAIDYKSIYQAVLADIQEYAMLAVEDEKKLIDRIQADNEKSTANNHNRYVKLIREHINRIKAIDAHLQSLFEEKMKGNVTDNQFKRMAQNYEVEQATLSADINQMEAELEESKRSKHELDTWIKRVKECITIDCLTRQIVVGLIDRIEVAQICNDDGEAISLNIFYKFGATANTK